MIIGGIMIVPSVISMLFAIGKDEGTVGSFGGILCFVQLVFLIASIFPTEVALRKNFDKHGNRKKHDF